MKVIFFDGVCGLCNGFVDFMLKVDKDKLFYFSPLQSEYAKTHLPENYTQILDSIVYLDNGALLTKSDAVLKILGEMGGIWKISAIGKVFPRFFSHFVYDLVATNRYKIFGKKENCRIPTPEERSRFLL